MFLMVVYASDDFDRPNTMRDLKADEVRNVQA
jgi:hypothetical protein